MFLCLYPTLFYVSFKFLVGQHCFGSGADCHHCHNHCRHEQMITYSVPFGKDERALMIGWHQNVGFLYTMKKQFDEYFLETKNVKDLDQVKARELDKDRQVPNER